MNCPRINKNAGPAGWLHSLCCAECRAAQRADDLLAFGVVQLRKEMNPHPALNRTLTALELPRLTENFYLRRQQRSSRRKRAAITTALLVGVGGWFVYMDEMPAYQPYDGAIDQADHAEQLPFANPTNMSLLSKRGVTDQLFNATHGLEFPSDTHVHPEADTLAKCLNSPDNRLALDAIRGSLPNPFRETPRRDVNDWQSAYTSIQYFGALLHANAVWREFNGSRLGAIEEAENLIEYGQKVAGAGSWNSRALGTSYQAEGRRLLWRQIGSMSAQEALHVRSRLEHTAALHKPLQTTAEWERVSNLTIEYEALRSPFWRWNCTGTLRRSEIYPFSELQRLAFMLRLYARSNRQTFQDLTDFTTMEGQAFSGPYSDMTQVKLLETYHQDLVSQLLLTPSLVTEPSAIANICFNDFESETQNALLTTALAIRAYHVEHGVNPPTLEALCPKYLSHLPADPFNPGRALQYKPQYTYDDQSRLEEAPQLQKQYPSYVLYSVGPDGFDHSGTSIYYMFKGRNARQVYPDSLGDIVAGINQ